MRTTPTDSNAAVLLWAPSVSKCCFTDCTKLHQSIKLCVSTLSRQQAIAASHSCTLLCASEFWLSIFVICTRQRTGSIASLILLNYMTYLPLWARKINYLCSVLQNRTQIVFKLILYKVHFFLIFDDKIFQSGFYCIMWLLWVNNSLSCPVSLPLPHTSHSR